MAPPVLDIGAINQSSGANKRRNSAL